LVNDTSNWSKAAAVNWQVWSGSSATVAGVTTTRVGVAVTGTATELLAVNAWASLATALRT
jgi:hypothetical protein